MKELAAGMIKIKKSKFYAHLYEIENMDEMDEILKEHRKKYKKACHHCWAAIVNGEEKFKDDGEVGHPGRVILEVLKKYELDSHALVVSRIFGGVKLGVGGVSRAFREAAEGVAREIKFR
ncbi:MAG: YigZ family protein [Euryarchaeota archaeon]|nr:YigZ family protein [Euryarchaeota archaeon]